jgi:AcrR family transcriptional regulator
VDFRWYLRRLRRMSVSEIGWRARTAAIQQLWKLRQPRPPAKGSVRWASPPLPTPGNSGSPARERLLRAANDVLAGRWHVFDLAFDTKPEAPDWHHDAKSGIRVDRERYCFSLPHRDATKVGVLKYVWEPSRLHHATVLAAAYHLFGDKRFAQHAAAHLRSWWRDNPPLRGVHWISGIELGMRLIAWTWIRRLLTDWPGVGALFEDNPDFLLQLQEHQRWLATLYSRGSSANNHLIAEAAGLFIASTAFAGGAQQSAHATLAAGILEQEAVTQTFPDGLNRELAFGYHGYVLGLLMLAAIEGEASGRPFSDDYWRAMTRMGDAMAANLEVDAQGVLHAPQQGDGDDAWALMVDSPELGAWAPLLDCAGLLLGRRDWWPEPAVRSVLAELAAPLARNRRASDPRPVKRPNRFADAGVTLLREFSGSQAITCRVDHGPHGFLSTNAHGHADALAFELWVGGQPVLVDPGTYCYQSDPVWRRYFRSTLAHNTLELGGVDQAVQAGTFLWSSTPSTWVESAEGLDGGSLATLIVAHDGYRRLEAHATHVRTFRLDRALHVLTITDRIDAKASVPGRLAFHVDPSVRVILDGRLARLLWDRGAATVQLPSALDWRVHRGETEPPLGWHSPEFGRKLPSVTLVGTGDIVSDLPLETSIRIEGSPSPAVPDSEG